MSKKKEIMKYFSTVKQKDMDEKDLEIFKIIRRFGFDVIRSDELVTDSLSIAKIFERRHDNYLSSLRTKIKNMDDKQFAVLNFKDSEIKDKSGKMSPIIYVTRAGLQVAISGLTGEKALQYHVEYAKAFEVMGNWITYRLKSRTEYQKMSQSLKEYRESIGKESTMFFHYSNEADMINRIVLGLSAKQFKELNGIDSKVQSIRDYLSKDEIYYIDDLQEKNTHLIELGMNYEDRQNKLIEYYLRISQKQIGGN